MTDCEYTDLLRADLADEQACAEALTEEIDGVDEESHNA